MASSSKLVGKTQRKSKRNVKDPSYSAYDTNSFHSNDTVYNNLIRKEKTLSTLDKDQAEEYETTYMKR